MLQLLDCEHLWHGWLLLRCLRQHLLWLRWLQSRWRQRGADLHQPLRLLWHLLLQLRLLHLLRLHLWLRHLLPRLSKSLLRRVVLRLFIGRLGVLGVLRWGVSCLLPQLVRVLLLLWLSKSLLRRVVLRLAKRRLGLLLAVWSLSIQLLLTVRRLGLRVRAGGMELGPGRLLHVLRLHRRLVCSRSY
jgi:hypothetical protein